MILNKDIPIIVLKKSIAQKTLIYRIISNCKFAKHLPMLNLAHGGAKPAYSLAFRYLSRYKVKNGKLKFSYTSLGERSKLCLSKTKATNSGEGSSRRENFRERSEQHLLFPYYPISLFPFKKGGVPC